ncbi:hypothetical protein PG995_005627 [Apiospora arundinis]
MRRPTADPPVRCMPPIGLSPAPSFRIRHAHHAATPAAHGACHHKAAVSFCPRQYKTYLKQLFPVLDNTKPAAAAMSAGQAIPTAVASAAAADHDGGENISHVSPTTSSTTVHNHNNHNHNQHYGPPPTTSSTTTYTPSQSQKQPLQQPQSQLQPQYFAQLPPQQQLQHLQNEQQQMMSTLETGTSHVPMHLPELPQVGSDRAWVIVKIVFRAICLLIGLGLLVICGYSWMSLVPRGGQSSLLLPIGMFATGWNTSEFITMAVRWRGDQRKPNRTSRRPRGLPAKAHVGCELLLTLGGVVGFVWQSIFSIHPRYPPPPDGIGAMILLIFLGAFEFVLFVRSCVEVDRRKKDRRIQQLVIALQIQQQQNLQIYQQQQEQQRQQRLQQEQQLKQQAAMSSAPPSETAPSSWGQAPTETMSEYDRELRELNTKYFGPMPEPPEDPRDLQKVLIIAPHLRGIVGS